MIHAMVLAAIGSFCAAPPQPANAEVVVELMEWEVKGRATGPVAWVPGPGARTLMTLSVVAVQGKEFTAKACWGQEELEISGQLLNADPSRPHIGYDINNTRTGTEPGSGMYWGIGTVEMPLEGEQPMVVGWSFTETTTRVFRLRVRQPK